MRTREVRLAGTGAIVLFLFLAPAMARALGLGQIESDTHIGQTLEARIPILAADANALQGLSVSLAYPAAYQRAGLKAPDFLFTLKFQIKRGPQGPYVLVTSPTPVRLPFLNLLVRARWTSGEVTRRYTLLLNPPVLASTEAPRTPVQVSASERFGRRSVFRLSEQPTDFNRNPDTADTMSPKTRQAIRELLDTLNT